jgi:glycine cleavage system transcriptional repressor
MNYVISVMHKDRVGIIADVTSAIKQLGGNLEDMSQTVMRGYFTMLLLAAFPDGTDEATLRSALSAVKDLADFEIGIVPFEPDANNGVKADDSEDRYVLTASGPDAPGLVAAIAEYLRQKGINIIDLTTQANQGRYIMMFLVQLQPQTDVGKLKHSLRIAMSDLGIQTELRHQALFKMTNEI